MSQASPRSRSLRRKCGFLALTALLLLLTIEALSQLGLLLLDTSRWSSTQERLARAGIADREYGEMLHPYVGILYDPDTNPGFEFNGQHVPVNHLGLTGAPDPVSRHHPDRLLIGLLGGSLAWALGHETVETLRATLQQDPRFAHRKIVLIDLALPGFKQPQQVMIYNYLLALGAEFDVLVNLDGFNEVALSRENWASRVNSAYPTSWPLRVHDVPDSRVLSQSIRVLELRAQRQRFARSLQNSWWRWSAFRQAVWRMQDIRCARELQELGIMLKRHQETHGPSFATAGPKEDVHSLDDVVPRSAQLWRRCSQQLHDLATARGTLYLHFLQPNQYVPESKPLNHWEQENVIFKDGDYDKSVRTGYPCLQQEGSVLKSGGVRFFDLTDIYRNSPQQIYIDWCCHVNREGNEMIARRIGQEILNAWTDDPDADIHARSRTVPPTPQEPEEIDPQPARSS